MTITDPIADMLTRIRNSLAVQQEFVEVPYSKIKLEIAEILKKSGYIEGFRQKDGKIIIHLKYYDQRPVISSIRRVSKPGRRVYAKAKDLPRVKQDLGIAIISTPAGLMTNKEARKKKLGGEVICEVW